MPAVCIDKLEGSALVETWQVRDAGEQVLPAPLAGGAAR